MFNLWYFFCLRTDADQESSGGISTTQSTLEMMRTSRNGTIRSGTIPSVQMYVLTWLYAYLFELSADIDATKIVVSSWRKNKDCCGAVECV